MLEKYRSSILPIFILLLITLLAYWPISLYTGSLQWDMIDQYFPWRKVVVEQIRSGSLPFWNPYQFLGYPLHADPQSGVWYPPVWIMSLFGEYGMPSLHIEVLFHLFMAGFGMFILLRGIGTNILISIAGATAYMCSGFFAGNAQHFTWIIAGTWIPWVLHYFNKLTSELKYKYAILCGVFFSLLLTGGYPAFAMVLIYFLLGIFLYRAFKIYKTKQGGSIQKLFLNASIAATVCIILSAGSLISIWESLEHITRSSSVSNEAMALGPFSPQCMVSFGFPLSVTKDPAYFDTDTSMSNGHFGIIVLLLLPLMAMQRSNRKYIWILFSGVFMLLASFGDYTPVRAWLYDFAPLMNLFRFPSLFRLFFILAFIICAALVLKNWEEEKLPRGINLWLPLLGGGFLVAMVTSFFGADLYFLNPGNFKSMGAWLRFIPLRESIILQSFFQLILILVFIILSFRIKIEHRKKLFSFFWIAESILALNFVLPVTVTSLTPPSVIQFKVDQQPKGYIIPDTYSMVDHNDIKGSFFPFWRNTNVFHKQPGWDGFTPFFLKDYIIFLDSKLFAPVMGGPFVQLASGIANYSDTLSGVEKGFFYTSGSERKTLGSGTAQVADFKPGYVKIKATMQDPGIIYIVQNPYPGWVCKVNGNEAKLLSGNLACMGVEVNKGESVVEYLYENKNAKTGYWISLFSWILLLPLLGFISIKKY